MIKGSNGHHLAYSKSREQSRQLSPDSAELDALASGERGARTTPPRAVPGRHLALLERAMLCLGTSFCVDNELLLTMQSAMRDMPTTAKPH